MFKLAGLFSCYGAVKFLPMWLGIAVVVALLVAWFIAEFCIEEVIEEEE